MATIPLDTLAQFLIRAKQATYVGDAAHSLPYRLESKDIQYAEGDWAYHDCYFGDSNFIGEEIVYYRRYPVWGMNYYGYLLHPDRFTSEQAGHMIKVSLSRLYSEGRFLGGFEYNEGDLKYIDTNEGDISRLVGKEMIELNGEIVYELVYHGGILEA
jgi:Domain of unknown function (DUF5680)